jgi:hypothetical protein
MRVDGVHHGQIVTNAMLAHHDRTLHVGLRAFRNRFSELLIEITDLLCLLTRSCSFLLNSQDVPKLMWSPEGTMLQYLSNPVNFGW